MELLYAFSGMLGALCCVGMYAAVSVGRVSAERPLFFIINGVGALLVMLGAWHSFDLGDLGTISQELTWAMVSVIGAVRAQRARARARKIFGVE